MSNCEESVFINICQKGIYYHPSHKHYNANSVVNCDRCKRYNINICIGWKTYDLCMKCVQEVSDQIIKDEPKFEHLLEDLDLEERTFMEQSKFKPSKPSYSNTRMMQNMFNK